MDHNVHPGSGLFLAIDKRIFVYADNATAPKHFTNLLTPLISDDDDAVENNDMLKSA